MATKTKRETSTLELDTVIRLAQGSSPKLGRSMAVKAAEVPKDALRDLRHSLLMTMATSIPPANGVDDIMDPNVMSYAELLGVQDLAEEREPDANTPHFNVSTNLTFANPDKTARVSIIGQLEKEYIAQLGQYGVEPADAKRQYKHDYAALEGVMDSLSVSPSLRAKAMADQIQHDKAKAERVTGSDLKKAVEVLKKMEAKVDPQYAAKLHAAMELLMEEATKLAKSQGKHADKPAGDDVLRG